MQAAIQALNTQNGVIKELVKVLVEFWQTV
jgi:hypothetical protein